ncbi:MAG: hypothetical protein WCQ47_06255, partial [bacterium]
YNMKKYLSCLYLIIFITTTMTVVGCDFFDQSSSKRTYSSSNTSLCSNISCTDGETCVVLNDVAQCASSVATGCDPACVSPQTCFLSSGTYGCITPSTTCNQSPDVYVSGYRHDATLNRDLASYWKNNMAGVNDFNSADPNSSYANSISFDGTNLYIGTMSYGGPQAISSAYWINGSKTVLAPIGSNSDAPSIFVKGSDIYSAGSYQPTSTTYQPAYWLNGSKTDLSLGGVAHSYAAAVRVSASGSDVYVTGDYTNSGNYGVAVYWKNGVMTTLSAPSGASDTSGIGLAVSGGISYIAGYYYLNSIKNACYWKNGSITTLSPTNSSAKSIFISGTDVYVSGSYTSNGKEIACYWRNGVKTDLPVPSTAQSSYTTSIFVHCSGVYISGVYKNSSGKNVAVFWKDSTRNELTDGTQHSNASDISVY